MTGTKQTAVSELRGEPEEPDTSLGQMKSCDIETPGRPQTARLMMQYRKYKLLFCTTNKYLQHKWKKAYDLHRRKVNSMKPTICMDPPRKYNHLALGVKNKQLEETTRIQGENDVLKKKISHIMATTGRVDNRNDYEKKSLNKEKRQQELLCITKNNQMLQFRLSQCKPHYNVRSWNEDWLKTLKMRDRIARYPQKNINQQKGQGKPSKMSSDCDQEQKTSTDSSTHSHPASDKANGKPDSKENEKRKEIHNKGDAGGEIHKELATQFALEPHLHEKSISPSIRENRGSSDTN